MAYCSEDQVKAITGLTSNEITDAQISGIIVYAASQLNADIQVKWEDERVKFISLEKENAVDGDNKKFYTRHYPIGDSNNDGWVSGGDVYAYTIDSEGNRASVVISGISDTAKGGPIWLVSAPASDETLYFTYHSSPVDMEAPHGLVRLACMQLAAALCFTRIDAKKVQSFRVGKVAVMKPSQAFDIFRRQYYDTINRIRSEIVKVERSGKVL